MADWKDFFEDGKEFHGQFLDSLERKAAGKNGQPEPPPPLRFCPLCDRPFLDDDQLLAHIRSVHGPQHVYLRVNGSVIRDVGWAASGISELTVVPIGFPTVSVALHAQKFTRSIQATTDTNLLPLVPRDFEGQLTVEVTAGSAGRRKFVVYTRSLPEFRHDALDSIVRGLSSEAVGSEDMPDITLWRQRVQRLNELETRYLSGFFEYVLAFHIEKFGERKRAKQHFDEALGYLLPFRTPLAESAQCVLGLRMNCFGVLRRAPRSSVLSYCNTFFNGDAAAPSESNLVKEPNPFITYADEFTLLLVKSISNYSQADFAECKNNLHALEFHPSAHEKNNEDKLSLLSGRLHRILGARAVAIEAYSRLQFHPDFGPEAKEFISGAA